MLDIDILELSKGRFSTTEKFKNDIQYFGLSKLSEPTRYIRSSAIEPFLDFILNHLGDKRVIEVLNTLEIGEEIFVFRDTPIDINKVHILLSTLIEEKILARSNIKDIAQLSTNEKNFGEKIFYLLQYEKQPLKRYDLLFKQGPQIENCSEISLKNTSKNCANIDRLFKIPAKNNSINIRGLKDNFDRNIWCEYFHHYLRSIAQIGSKVQSFEIFKASCQWSGDSLCSYELQFDN